MSNDLKSKVIDIVDSTSFDNIEDIHESVHEKLKSEIGTDYPLELLLYGISFLRKKYKGHLKAFFQQPQPVIKQGKNSLVYNRITLCNLS